MKTKLSCFVLALFLTTFTLPVHASTWVGSVSDGLGNTIVNAQGFDWSSSGSGVATGLGPAGSTLVPGQKFDFLYQSFLYAVTDPDGQQLAFPGLNSAFEYTIVASIPEEVLQVVPLNATTALAVFSTLPGGLFYIYYSAPANAQVTAGQGFEDGTLVAWGTIDAGQASTHTYNTSNGQGIGSTQLVGTVSYANSAYLQPADSIISFRYDGTLNFPPLDSATTNFFDGNLLPSYTVQTNDLLFKVDASSKFIASDDVVGDCRVTAGGVKDGITVPCDTKKNGTPDPKTCVTDEWDTWGGQAGAQPGIDGNWTHHHVVSPKQSFVFHSNDLDWIGCSDPGCCVPACANAKNRQIDFSGIGHFNNQKGYSPELPSGDLCFDVHLEDIGEPGPGGKWPSSTTPCSHCPGTEIVEGDCVDCTDYYEIKIYDSAARNGEGECAGELIYFNGPGVPDNCSIGDPLRFGYFTRAGNVQMHPPNN